MATWLRVEAPWVNGLQAFPLEPAVVEELLSRARVLLAAHAARFHGGAAVFSAPVREHQPEAPGTWPQVDEARLEARVGDALIGDAHAEFVEWNPRDGCSWKLRMRFWWPGIMAPAELAAQDNTRGTVEVCFQEEHGAVRDRVLRLVTGPNP